MEHFIPVYLWLRLASPARKMAVSANPMLLLPRMTKVCSMLSSLWWGFTLMSIFSLVWKYPGSFWYVIPLLSSLGILVACLLGTTSASDDYRRAALGDIWSDQDNDARWPRKYRALCWQLDLAYELMGSEAAARLQAQSLEVDTPATDKAPTATLRRL